MNRYLLPILAISCLVASCDAPPESYFGRAVLSLNMLHGFAGSGLERQLKEPSMKLVEGSQSDVIPMSRKEVIDGKIQFAEDSYRKIKELKETDETRPMLQASKAVYEYILPVLREEYHELARLYDGSANQEEIDALAETIRGRYAEGYRSRMDALVAAAKPYAERHGIAVKWDMQATPGD